MDVTEADDTDWRSAMSNQNEKRVREMTDTEREEERQQVIERFGPGIIDLINKAKRRRGALR